MPRQARVVVPGVPHHVTHRGNRRQRLFFAHGDFATYKRWLCANCERYGLDIWRYCLMPNHIHLLAVPHALDSLARAVGHTHGRFAQWQNRKHRWSGHLWSNRYYSVPLDGRRLWVAARYIDLNPVRAGLVRRAEKYRYSSAASANGADDDLLAASSPFPGAVRDWAQWLGEGLDEEAAEALRRDTRSGRPATSAEFLASLEARLERDRSAVAPRGQVGRSGRVL